MDEREAITESILNVNISHRFKDEAGSIFTKAFVDDAILMFREMKKRAQFNGKLNNMRR